MPETRVAAAARRLREARALPWTGALGLLREWRWLRSLLGVLVLCVAFVLLGRWQYHRHEGKVERRDVVQANYSADPVPLASVLGSPAAELAPSKVWGPVEADGVYEPSGTILVRNRDYRDQIGYEVIVPLRLAGGARLLVDRGWIPGGQSAARPDAVPAAPGGGVQVVVRLRPTEGAGSRPPPGQAMRIDVAGIAAADGGRAGADVYRAYGVLAQESPAPANAPRLLDPPDVGLGPHLAYAIQWWGFAVAALVMLGYYALREAAARRDSGRPQARRG